MTVEQYETQIRHAIQAGDWHTAETYGARLNQAATKQPVPLVAAALWYAGQGLPVFPLQPGLKIPYARTQGFKDASTDPQQIRRWWAWSPQSNIGLATGHLVDVIDIDGPAGVRTWAQLLADDALPTVVGVANTPRPGGTHLYVTAAGRGNKAGVYPGIDYRGLGGYVVAPPSTIRPDQAHPGVYRWRRPLLLAATA